MKHFARAAAAASFTLLAVAGPAWAADLSILYSFSGTSGSGPRSALTIDAAGNLFGTAGSGGGGGGTVFKLEKGTADYAATPTVLASFAATGSGPRTPQYSPLTLDIAGNLYGVTSSGGTAGQGAAFRIDANTNKLVTLASFSKLTGSSPAGSVVLDANGALWGTSNSGGGPTGSGLGTVWRIDNAATTNAGSVTKVADLGTSAFPGYSPRSGLTTDAAGNMYGITTNTTVGFGGIVFKVASDGTITRLESVNAPYGNGVPFGGLTFDTDGNAYGLSRSGGSAGGGFLYKLSAANGLAVGSRTILATFDGNNGSQAYGNVLIDADGNLFGTAGKTAFRFDGKTNALTVLATFNAATVGSDTVSYGGLVADAAGSLYGTTYAGGASNAGTLFRIADAGFVTASVPEPATWGLMLAGFGMVGAAMRRRSEAAVAA